ncbi:MAG: GyrI-like domain-containing protein [Alkaliphilus sp.]
MNHKIERKEAFAFSGMTRTFSTENGENFVAIPKYWNEIMKDGRFEILMKKSTDGNCVGVCMPVIPAMENSFDYIIGIFSKREVAGYDYHEVPSVEWAIFEVRGPIGEELQKAWKYIMYEWAPKAGYERANLPELEVYYAGDVNDKDYLTEIWVPIQKR